LPTTTLGISPTATLFPTVKSEVKLLSVDNLYSISVRVTLSLELLVHATFISTLLVVPSMLLCCVRARFVGAVTAYVPVDTLEPSD